jgi:hypothetical protein
MTRQIRYAFRPGPTWFIVVLLTLCPLAATASADDASIASDVQEAYRGGDYQTSLPGITEPLPQPEDVEPVEPADTTDLGWLGDAVAFVLKWLSVAGFAVAAGFVLIAAYRAWQTMRLRPRRSDRDGDHGDPGSGFGGAPSTQGRLADAEAMARRGAYAEAIHLLLLAVVEIMRQRADQTIAPAMTARELVRAATLGDDRRDDLAGLVATSERGHFGGRPADRPTFEQCRDQARRLVDGMAGA